MVRYTQVLTLLAERALQLRLVARQRREHYLLLEFLLNALTPIVVLLLALFEVWVDELAGAHASSSSASVDHLGHH